MARVEIKADATVGAAERVDIFRHLDNMHECTYNFMMKLDWDPAKAASNQRKHNVDFADAVSVLVVVYAWRGDTT